MEGETNGDRDSNTHLKQDISIHIFTVSSAMVGVCLTVIRLIRMMITLGTADTLADDFLSGDALLFLVSCLLSYGALRSRSGARNASHGKGRGHNIYHCDDRNGDHLCIDHLHDICSSPTRRGLKQLFKIRPGEVHQRRGSPT